VVPTPSPSRRRLLLGGAGVLALGGAGAGVAADRAGRVEIPLYSETVAFSAPRLRELVLPPRLGVLVPGTRVLRDAAQHVLLLEDEEQWLAGCAPWVRSAADDDGLLRSALLDLRALSAHLPASVAGWSRRWRYAWPRDVSFVAAALARAGRPDDAVHQLGFLQSVQRRDGWFEARYDLGTGGAPDDRVPQLDGTGWVLWAADQVARHAPDRAGELLAPLRPMLVRSAAGLLASLDAESALPPVSSDYWELVEDTLTLGTAAAVLAGLRSASTALPVVDELSLTDRTRAASDLLGAQVRAHFGPDGYPRLLGGSAADAAITFLVPPIGPTAPDLEVMSALDRAQTSMSRPAGGLAPGAAWKEDGISWTPETALFAAAWAATGYRSRAEALLRWLGDHRTAAGSFPEKVLHDGRPAAVAPLAWTAALVVIARHELEGRG
jgi:GH15 family glucan-1,4-alpha-glucosidase